MKTPDRLERMLAAMLLVMAAGSTIVAKSTQRRSWRRVLLLSVLMLLPLAPAALADDSTKLVFFGDSLSDPGNYFAAFGTVSRPPFAPIPDAPYAIGGHHFSNGARHGPSSLPRICTGRPAGNRPSAPPASSRTTPSVAPGHAPAPHVPALRSEYPSGLLPLGLRGGTRRPRTCT